VHISIASPRSTRAPSFFATPSEMRAEPPTSHALPLTNVFRKDELRPSLPRDLILAAAPAAEQMRFRVPRILGEEA